MLGNPACRLHRPCRHAYFRPLVTLLEDPRLPSFVTPATYAVGLEPRAVATGDFNHDGTPDLAVLNFEVGRPQP
jgi:hypothetical protein